MHNKELPLDGSGRKIVIEWRVQSHLGDLLLTNTTKTRQKVERSSNIQSPQDKPFAAGDLPECQQQSADSNSFIKNLTKSEKICVRQQSLCKKCKTIKKCNIKSSVAAWLLCPVPAMMTPFLMVQGQGFWNKVLSQIDMCTMLILKISCYGFGQGAMKD